MRPHPLLLLLPACLAALAAGCGARTGLDLPSPPGAAVPGLACPSPKPPWVLFDLVYTSTASPRRGLYAVHADGSEGHDVNLPHAPAFYPSVSRDGATLLYASQAPGGAALYRYDLATGADRLVLTTPELSYSALSPDGATIAYVTGYTLRAVGADGTGDRALLVGPNGGGTGYGHPVFGASSATVIYGTGGAIGEIGVDGSGNTTLLTTIPDTFQYPNPAFSPDGTRLVFGAFCGRDSPDALLILPYASLPGAACGTATVLTMVGSSASNNEANDPSWSAEGLIAYASGSDVFVIDPAGGAPANLTAGLTGDGGIVTASDPVWVPGCARLP